MIDRAPRPARSADGGPGPIAEPPAAPAPALDQRGAPGAAPGNSRAEPAAAPRALTDRGLDIAALAQRVVAGEIPSERESLAVLAYPSARMPELFAAATRVRLAFTGTHVHRCGIVNAKSGACAENCSFCSQSAHVRQQTGTAEYAVMSPEAMLERSREAADNGAEAFGLVTAWRGPRDDAGFARLEQAVRQIASEGRIEPHASLGVILDQRLLQRLIDAGLTEYHHNLETAKSHYPTICTTRPWQDNYDTVRLAKRLGLATCSGGIFGLGESDTQRVEFATQLRSLAPTTIPINFLVPVPGTPLFGRVPPVSPLDALRIIAMLRFTNPKSDLLIAGGRDLTLRDLQAAVFWAGANGAMIGDYLTTRGRTVPDDLQMFADLDLDLDLGHGPGGPGCEA